MDNSRQFEIATSKKKCRVSAQDFEQIKESLSDLQFGSIQITVQDGFIVQIDRTEKRRLRMRASNLNES